MPFPVLFVLVNSYSRFRTDFLLFLAFFFFKVLMGHRAFSFTPNNPQMSLVCGTQNTSGKFIDSVNPSPGSPPFIFLCSLKVWTQRSGSVTLQSPLHAGPLLRVCSQLPGICAFWTEVQSQIPWALINSRLSVVITVFSQHNSIRSRISANHSWKHDSNAYSIIWLLLWSWPWIFKISFKHMLLYSAYYLPLTLHQQTHNCKTVTMLNSEDQKRKFYLFTS